MKNSSYLFGAAFLYFMLAMFGKHNADVSYMFATVAFQTLILAIDRLLNSPPAK